MAKYLYVVVNHISGFFTTDSIDEAIKVAGINRNEDQVKEYLAQKSHFYAPWRFNSILKINIEKEGKE